jgi:hypothetical protein
VGVPATRDLANWAKLSSQHATNQGDKLSNSIVKEIVIWTSEMHILNRSAEEAGGGSNALHPLEWGQPPIVRWTRKLIIIRAHAGEPQGFFLSILTFLIIILEMNPTNFFFKFGSFYSRQFV